MVGKDCVAIACDLRLGLQALTVSNNFPKIFQYGDVLLGLTGLATDVATVSDLFRYKVNMYRLREERNIAPSTFANLVSSSLYERRFGPYFVSPVVAGLDQKTGKPFICGFDSIGCIDFAKDFIVSGTATEQLFGMCESLWEPDMVRLDLDFRTLFPPGIFFYMMILLKNGQLNHDVECSTIMHIICTSDLNFTNASYQSTFATGFDEFFANNLNLLDDLQCPEDLFETISQALLNAVDRDALSGWGAHVYIIEKDKVTKRLLKGRQD
ncbi:proteasome component PUP3 [Zalerion maritima]|uniref:Proteasome component PUP3 n=1 Tax=Zalerion maritima TaxID=339359 RepID=A0AAD5RPQ1_9PEZI|nr:proteasome component PUP3 [Zalerion maritima]